MLSFAKLPVGKGINAVFEVCTIRFDIRGEGYLDVSETVDSEVLRHTVLQFQFEVESRVFKIDAL